MDQYPRARAPMGAPLSLEASLDEENKEVLSNITRQRTAPASRVKSRGETPPPMVRSMLNVDSPPPRHGSIAGIGVGITNPRDQRRPSRRLDPADPSTWTSSHTTGRPRSNSAQQQGLPKIEVDQKYDFESKYNFDMSSMPTTGGGAISSPEKKQAFVGESKPAPSLMSAAYADVSTTSPTSKHLLLTPDSPHIPAKMASDRRFSNKSNSFSDVSEPIGRVDKDEEIDEDAMGDSSEDDAQSSSSEIESPQSERGRKRDQELPKDEIEKKKEGDEEAGNEAAPQSRGVRSLLDPVSSPSRPAERKPEVHPGSSFGRSGPTQADFEDNDMEADIEKAKSLGLFMSPVDDSVADRHVRMIIRGDWARIQEEHEQNSNTSRLYLACTDLSLEAWYALEWTVGTMLRDGDTLLAIYAIEDESAPKEAEGNREVLAESAKAAHDAKDTMTRMTRQATDLSDKGRKTSQFIPVTEAPLSTKTVDARLAGKKEMERLTSMDEIVQNFLKLVRRTPLQIRCMIEVIHCKSPKHLILNAIDELDPTLCVVGTRGRSSLKGVLLGSFSNYLVTKSSVPVMVARKRLKKPKHAKVSSSAIRLSNNLVNSALPRRRRGLENARID